MKIVVVDDHELFRDGLATLIVDLIPGAEVVGADGGRAAEAVVGAGGVDLVLVDLRLADGSGLALMERLAERDPSLPMVVISAFDERAVVDRALAAGASGFLPKQLSRKAMGRALSRILAGEVWSPYDAASEGEGADAAALPPEVGERLTPRQREVLALLLEGLPNKRIAARLGMAEKTVKAHLSAVFGALGVRNRAEAVARTLELRLSV
ncbi:response regulator transcription factor [Endothiovibrio diazotrophicus]